MASARPRGGLVLVLLAVVVIAALLVRRFTPTRGPITSPKETASAELAASSSSSPAAATPAVPLSTNEVAQSLIVTVELDADEKTGIREALNGIERRYQPEAGSARTFAVLDADGQRTPSGKLHMQMHLSMERPGLGSLVSRRTGEVYWKARIIPRRGPPPGEKGLTIVMQDPQGKQVMLDGSKGAANVLDVPLSGTNVTPREVWPDGQEREFIFTYSTCGCPVHAKVRRMGETTMRTTELPVMFPDDPEALRVIHQIMGWPPPP